MSKYIKTGKLFLHDTARSRHESDIFIGSTDQDDENKLIILIDFPRTRTDQSYLIDLIIKEIVEAYDNSDESNPEKLLEIILDNLNTVLPDISPKKNKTWLRDLNLLIAISDEGQLHFAQIGDIHALLLQDGRLTTISERNRHFNPLKLFNNITSGVLNPNDVVLLTTSPLLDYISEIKIKTVLKNFPPLEIVHKFEELLKDVPSFVTFNAVVIKFARDAREPKIVANEIEEIRKPNIIENLVVTERQARASRRASGRISRSAREYRKIPLYNWLRYGLSFFLTNAIEYFKLLGKIILNAFSIILSSFKFTFNKEYRSTKEQYLWDHLDRTVDRTSSNVKETSRLNRILIGATILIVVIFVNIIIFQGQIHQSSQQLDSFNEGLVSVANLQSQVDSTRIIGDDLQAEKLLLQIQRLTTTLLPNNADQEEQLVTLNENILRQLTEVRKINYIESPLLFQDLTTVAEPISDLNLLNDTIYFTTATNLYKVGGSDPLLQLPANTLQLVPNVDKNKLFVLTNDDILQIVDDKLSSVDLDTNDELLGINQALIYSDNLYLLDKSAGIIFKHAAASDGNAFRPGTIWLQDQNIVANSHSFAIDGNIYLLSNTGEIIKLYLGKRESFNYVHPNPELGANAKIYTRKESDFLYIMDPDNKRVAIINKDGKIKDQFISAKFDNLKSLAIDSEEKTIYLLNDKMVYLLAIKK